MGLEWNGIGRGEVVEGGFIERRRILGWARVGLLGVLASGFDGVCKVLELYYLGGLGFVFLIIFACKSLRSLSIFLLFMLGLDSRFRVRACPG